MQIRKVISTLAKLAISATLIGYLLYRARTDDQFEMLVSRPKNWPLLLCALPICLFAVTLTILRWNLLVRAIGLSFSLQQTLRAGFLGYLANLLPFGLVAGDSLKAVMLIHRNPRRKTEAVASVFVDRVLGLYALLLLAAGASLLLPPEALSRLADADRATIIRLCWCVKAASLASSCLLAVMLIPAVTKSRLWDRLEHAPVVGNILHKLVTAMRTYRSRWDLLAVAIGMSFVIHLAYVSAFVVMTKGMVTAVEEQPAVGSLLIIVPPSMIAGALPIGSLEVIFTLLFRAASPPLAPANMGLLIALTYRLIQICIATIGLGYWLTGRREVEEIMNEADETPPSLE